MKTLPHFNETESKEFEQLCTAVETAIAARKDYLDKKLQEKARFKVGDIVYGFNPKQLFRYKHSLDYFDDSKDNIPYYTVNKVHRFPQDGQRSYRPTEDDNYITIVYEISYNSRGYSSSAYYFRDEVGTLCATKEEWHQMYAAHLESEKAEIEWKLRRTLGNI